MSPDFTGLPPNKITTADPDTLLGQECELQDLDYSAYPVTQLSNTNVNYMRVRASGTVLANQHLIWVSGYEGLRVQAGGLADAPVGFAPPWTASIATGSHFQMIRKGLGKVITDGSGALAVGDVIVTAASGKVKIQVATTATGTLSQVQTNSRAGRMRVVLAATDGLAGRAYIDCTGN